MTNIAELLKDCPKGTKLYSPLFGEVEFVKIDTKQSVCVYPIIVTECNGSVKSFTKFGVYITEYRDSDCLLFPSKEVRTWEGWKAPKPHYDVANFKPFDKVLVRYADADTWRCTFFSHCVRGPYAFFCTDCTACQCIPYNDDTKHLLGTADMCPEEYINW